MGFRSLIGRAAGVQPEHGFAAALAAAGLAAVLSTPVLAGARDAPAGVVELFTSQGCSSCPAADSVLSQLVAEGKVVALAYHVDYWDYLGWRDTLGTPENTARQYDYMKSFGARSVYTPQAVINGRTHVNGASREEIDRVVGSLGGGSGGLSVRVKAIRDGSSLRIETDATKARSREAEVLVVYIHPPTAVEIERGENSGKTLVYWNAVTDVQVAGMWHGEAASFELPLREVTKKGTGGYAVLVQEVRTDGAPGAILGATMVREQRP